MNQSSLFELLYIFPEPGELMWIGLRPGRKQPMLFVEQAEAAPDDGLVGDHYHGLNGKRQVTLIQWEHLDTLRSITRKPVSPKLLRRNLAIRGINLLALKNRKFRIGDICLQGTGPCHPCSRMEDALGEGGLNAMRGHGGITAQIVSGGVIRIGDKVTACSEKGNHAD